MPAIHAAEVCPRVMAPIRSTWFRPTDRPWSAVATASKQAFDDEHFEELT